MVVVLVASCQDLAENGLPQLMPSPASPISHAGSPNKVKVIKKPRWKVRRREWLRFKNTPTETDVQTRTGICMQNGFYHLKAFDLHFIPWKLQYVIVHSFSLLLFTVSSDFLFAFHLENSVQPNGSASDTIWIIMSTSWVQFLIICRFYLQVLRTCLWAKWKRSETKFRALQGQIDYSVKRGDEIYLRRRFVSEELQRPEATSAAGTDPHDVLYTHTNKKTYSI